MLGEGVRRLLAESGTGRLPLPLLRQLARAVASLAGRAAYRDPCHEPPDHHPGRHRHQPGEPVQRGSGARVRDRREERERRRRGAGAEESGATVWWTPSAKPGPRP